MSNHHAHRDPHPSIRVLYEDNHVLVVDKPAELPTMGVSEELPSLIARAKQYIKRKYDKPGNVYMGIVSRLDAPVSGIVLLARTSKAAARLNEQFRARQVRKTYWAIVEGIPSPQQGSCVDWIRKKESVRRMQVVPRDASGAQEARLQYRVMKPLSRHTSLLEIELETGRKHQIRVQLAACGHSILGDEKYGSQTAFPHGIALHSHSLSFTHPVQQKEIELTVPPPPAWRHLLPLFD